MSIIGDAILLGGGGGLSGCIIVVQTDTGSTVAAYSNSSATTFVKAGQEIGTSGSYIISGLNTGTYYVKVSKGSFSKVSSAVTFSAVGIKEVTISASLYLIQDGAFASGVSFSSVTRGAYGSMTSRSGYIEHKPSSTYTWDGRAYRVDVTSYNTLSIEWQVTSVDLSYSQIAVFNSIGIDDTQEAITANITAFANPSRTGSRITTTLSLSGLTGNKYVGDGLLGTASSAVARIYNMWLE